MKQDQTYLICETCGASAPGAKVAKAAGWRATDNGWMCDSCYVGSVQHGIYEEEEDDDWIADDDWR